MTNSEFEVMTKAGDAFWLEFSALCQKYIDAAPKHLREEYRMFLGERTSIYGIAASIRQEPTSIHAGAT